MGACPPREISDFRPSEIVSEALFEVRTAPWRNQCSGATLSREGVAPRGQRMLTENGPGLYIKSSGVTT